MAFLVCSYCSKTGALVNEKGSQKQQRPFCHSVSLLGREHSLVSFLWLRKGNGEGGGLNIS